MAKTRLHAAIAALTVLAPLQSHAVCDARLAEIDQRIATSELDVNARNAVQQFRDQAASICQQGHDAPAMQALQIVEMMLGPVPARAVATSQPDAQVVEPALATESADRPDWAAIRAKAGKTHRNRWDDLTLLDNCRWLTAEELENGLGLQVSLQFRRTNYQCEYWYQTAEGRSVRVFTLYVEVHEDAASARKAESNLSSGFVGERLFTAFDPGVPDMNVYVSNKSTYLYVFPDNGVTLWRLGYMENTREKIALNKSTSGNSGMQDLGKRFIELLVDKYEDQL